jgi:hypothetical protein
MRRLILSLILLLATVLPTAAQDAYKLSRPGGADSDWVEDFKAPPPRSGAEAPAGFVLDINAAPRPRRLPDVPMSLPAAVQSAVPAFVKKLGARELNLLSSHDVIILVDKSGSMGDRDCPAPTTGLRFFARNGEPDADVSRWDWCESELVDMSRMAGNALRQGIRVVLFDNHYSVYDRVRVGEIPRIFQAHHPAGNTNAALALKSQLDSYFANRVPGRSRPVVVAVITDGLPSNARALKKAIIDATRTMNSPDEVAITFLQVGKDRKGVNLVHELDDDLVRQGAIYDIVDSKDFGELMQIGLGRALADAITESGRVARRD